MFTHLIGWRLIPLNFQQQRYEADFRFNLVRTRENSEQIAALHGEAAERERHLGRFGLIISNWIAIMQRQKQLMFFTQSYSQASVIFPYLMVSPAYFSGAMQLGGLMQTASAFNSVQGALSYFVSAYQSIAQYRAVVTRLSGFEDAIVAGRNVALTPPVIEMLPRETPNAISIDHLHVRLPNGEPLVDAEHIVLAPGERVLVTGPSGAGKSTLFRAITGIWPFGSGRVMVPKDAKVMLLPQRPYFPVAPLAAAVSYPAKAGTFDDARVAEVVAAVGLPEWSGRLNEEAHWNRMLSQGEQQRLGVARALLQEPDYLFLDEATASLDEAAEAMLYRLLAGPAQEHDDHFDRPPRDARRLPSPPRSRSCQATRHRRCATCRWFRRRSDLFSRFVRAKAGDLHFKTDWIPVSRNKRRTPTVNGPNETAGSVSATGRNSWKRSVDRYLMPLRFSREGEFRDIGRAAPIGGKAAGVKRRHRARAVGRGIIAGEDVTLGLGQVGVVVAQVERKGLVGPAKAGVPVPVARIGDTARVGAAANVS